MLAFIEFRGFGVGDVQVMCICYFFTFLKRLYVKVGRRKKFIEWGWEAQWSALNREMPAQKESLRSEGKSK